MKAPSKVKDYTQLKEEYAQKGYKKTTQEPIILQGEGADYKSDSMLYPTSDRTSVLTQPSDPVKIRLNTIGGSKWQISGQRLTWKVSVKESGLYKIAIKGRQNVINGAYSSRILLVNGEIPCKEAAAVRFPYSTRWQIQTIKAGGEDLLVYLNKGENEISLEVTLGDLAELQRKVSASLEKLNSVYQKIFMITGPSPDTYRDYQFHKQIPEVIEEMAELGKEIQSYYDEYRAISGQNGEQAQVLIKMARQLKELSGNPDKISSGFYQFKNNIVSMGSWLLTASQQPLEIDYIIIASPDDEIPKEKANFFKKLKFGVDAFLGSFAEDYSMVSGTSQEASRNITVWLGNSVSGGRDQAQVLKKMIDRSFTPSEGIGVNLQLVSMNSLLTATLAQKGPDVALSLSGSEPVNYAFRHAVMDLSGFEGFEKVAGRFHKEALTPLSFDNQVYGLPETQTFYMMFYRKDILTELGVSIPQTWDDVKELLPVLQKKQLNFGLPQTVGDYVGMGYLSYAMFLFQNGGNFYTEKGTASALNSKTAVDAFAEWTKYYTDYDLPTQYDFANRFRVGEVSIGIADYTMYNMLSVFSPEISGRWDFTIVPGTPKSDGTIDRSVAGNVTASVIMSTSKDPEAAWRFLYWWTDANAQTEFGLEMESTLGAAGRYAPANLEALSRMPWSAAQFKKISSQMQQVKGIMEVPGGYFTARELDFAYRRVINSAEDPGESLEDAARIISAEITSKRKEFQLNLE